MEEREAAEQLIKANRIRNEAFHSSFGKYVEFLDSLNEAQLVGFEALLGMFSSHEEPGKPLAYWRGIVDSRLFERYKLCMLCTKNHDRELQDLLTMSDAERMEYFHVRELGPMAPEVVCIHCGAEFDSMDARMKTEPGPDGCPGCLGQNFVRIGGHRHE